MTSSDTALATEDQDQGRMIEIEGADIAGETVQLDGHFYTGCSFTHCTMTFAGEKPWGHAASQFDNCRFLFVGRALMTLSIFADMIPDDDALRILGELRADRPMPN